MARFIGRFLIVLLTLFSLELTAPVWVNVVEPFTGFIATLSAWIITHFDDSVIAYGRVISDSAKGFSISIEAGCNGVEASIVLIAAVVAYPAKWRQRLLAIILGFLAIQVANLARIISLFYLGQWNIDVFTWIHLYLWPVLIMLDVLLVIIIFVRYMSVHPLNNELVS